MNDLSFAAPRVPYMRLSSSLAASGGPVPSKGSIASTRESVAELSYAVNSFSTTSPDMRSEVFSYSIRVRARFYWAAVLFLAGLSLSVFALVQSNQILGIVSAFMFAVSSLFALTWLERADRERSTLNH